LSTYFGGGNLAASSSIHSLSGNAAGNQSALGMQSNAGLAYGGAAASNYGTSTASQYNTNASAVSRMALKSQGGPSVSSYNAEPRLGYSFGSTS